MMAKKGENKFLFQGNKKAQVATTLSWFVAFIIIFFIMILFITTSVLIAGQRKLPIIGVGNDEIDVKIDTNSLEYQRILINYLESSFEIEGKKEKVKNYLFDLNDNSNVKIETYTYEFFKGLDMDIEIKIIESAEGDTISKTIDSNLIGINKRLDCPSGEVELELYEIIGDKKIKVVAKVCNGEFVNKYGSKNGGGLLG